MLRLLLGWRISNLSFLELSVLHSQSRITELEKTTWTRFAKLVLESVYEATILAAALNRKKNWC